MKIQFLEEKQRNFKKMQLEEWVNLDYLQNLNKN